MFPLSPSLFVFAAALTSQANAWGMLGHRTTALLASRLLTHETAVMVRTILAPTSLLSASTWPDYYSHTPEGRYSAPWHWIDAHDSPPSSCGIHYSRDCPPASGCIVSAIANHTARAMDTGRPLAERHMSLAWVVHFVGDVHQPLHTEDLARGGNGIKVLFDGHESNLHTVWDSGVSEKMRGGKAVRHAVEWADELWGQVLSGKYSNATTAWSTCLDIDRAQECALSWADETNKWMCDYVIPQGFPDVWRGNGDGHAAVDLAGEYYEGAKGIVDAQVAAAGWRMAGWLNAMFDPKGMSLEEIIEMSRNGMREALDVDL